MRLFDVPRKAGAEDFVAKSGSYTTICGGLTVGVRSANCVIIICKEAHPDNLRPGICERSMRNKSPTRERG
jgi:hypothetical protein